MNSLLIPRVIDELCARFVENLTEFKRIRLSDEKVFVRTYFPVLVGEVLSLLENGPVTVHETDKNGASQLARCIMMIIVESGSGVVYDYDCMTYFLAKTGAEFENLHAVVSDDQLVTRTFTKQYAMYTLAPETPYRKKLLMRDDVIHVQDLTGKGHWAPCPCANPPITVIQGQYYGPAQIVEVPDRDPEYS